VRAGLGRQLVAAAAAGEMPAQVAGAPVVGVGRQPPVAELLVHPPEVGGAAGEVLDRIARIDRELGGGRRHQLRQPDRAGRTDRRGVAAGLRGDQSPQDVARHIRRVGGVVDPVEPGVERHHGPSGIDGAPPPPAAGPRPAS
jgi:hypothetical protein